jgi:hypothetical protein
MSLEKFGFKAIQSSASSSSNNSSLSGQDLLTHIGSLQDTVAAVQSSLICLEKNTKDYSEGLKCPKCIVLRSRINDLHEELRKRRTEKEMIQRIQSLEKKVKALENENFRLKFLNNKDKDKSEDNNNNNNNNNKEEGEEKDDNRNNNNNNNSNYNNTINNNIIIDNNNNNV